jgi:hypothetical protein
MPHDSNPAPIRVRGADLWHTGGKMRPELLPEDCHDEAVEFLTTVFPGSQDAPFLRRELRHWKYYGPHPFMKNPRCYVFRDPKGLIAHGGLSPVQYELPGGIKTSFQVIDWAGSPRCPGAGFLLFRELWSTADSYLAIGGSDDAIKINRRIPAVRPVAGMALFGCPLRPLGQLMASPLSWRSPFRWARSWKWKMGRRRPDLSAWKAVPLDRLVAADAPLLTPAASGAYIPLRRTPDLVNYWLACPAGRVRAWRLEHAGVAVGFLALSFLRKEARIVDLVLNTPSIPLAEAYSMAIDIAQRHSDACELRGASSAPPAIQAMGAAGMIKRGVFEVFLGDPGKNFPQNPPVEVNFTIGDGFYQQAAQPYFYAF